MIKARDLVTSSKIKSKIVIVGSISTGKSALISRFLQNQFIENQSTTGALYYKKSLFVQGTEVMLNLWDTAGQERFKSVSKMYFRNAHVFLLVFDLGRPETLVDCEDWLNLIRENCVENPFKVILVGNKCDVDDIDACKSAGLKFAQEKDIDVLITSCKTGEHVVDTFQLAAQHSFTLLSSQSKEKDTFVDALSEKEMRTKDCC